MLALPFGLAITGTLAITATLAATGTLAIAFAATCAVVIAGAMGGAHGGRYSERRSPRGHDPVALQVCRAPLLTQALEVPRDRMAAETVRGDVTRALLRVTEHNVLDLVR